MRTLLFAASLAAAALPVEAFAGGSSDSWGSFPPSYRDQVQADRLASPPLSFDRPAYSPAMPPAPATDPMSYLPPPVYANPYPGQPYWTMPLDGE